MSRLAHTYDTHHNRFLQSGNAQLTGGGIKKNKERPLTDSDRNIAAKINDMWDHLSMELRNDIFHDFIGDTLRWYWQLNKMPEAFWDLINTDVNIPVLIRDENKSDEIPEDIQGEGDTGEGKPNDDIPEDIPEDIQGEGDIGEGKPDYSG